MYQTEKTWMEAHGIEELQTFTLSFFVSDYIKNHDSICPSGGEYTVKEETQEILCSLHDGGEVPEETHTESPKPSEIPGSSTGGHYYTGGNTSNRYAPGDIFGQGNFFYKCTEATTKGPKQDISAWEEIKTADAPTYDTTKTYGFGNIVKNNKGFFYICISTTAQIAPPTDNNADHNNDWVKMGKK